MADKSGPGRSKCAKRFSIRHLISPVFIVVLAISLFMWLLTKLSHSYTTDIAVTVTIDEHPFHVECVARGTGYSLLYYNIFERNRVIAVRLGDMAATPSTVNPGYYVISPSVLQQIISRNISNLQIVSLSTATEFNPNPSPE
ncbi:MAG: hypothetical protein FWE10_03185 [Rikenellaceae bacterium]|nr:hypothetical protein [Rikenellaceae bacterium]MCL2693164.1 hypothetical protein [Rikenellaceae bacterium]